MAASRNPLLASLKQTFALAYGCDVRTARRHCNANSAKWQEFIARSGMAAAQKIRKPEAPPPTDAEAVALQVLSPASPPPSAPPQASQPDAELSLPEKIVKQQWNIYAQASRAWLQAMKDQNELAALNFGIATTKALDAYYRALAKFEAWQVSMRRYIAFDEVQALFPIMEALFDLIRAIPAEIALEANPTNPALARRAAEEWLANRFNPQARSFLQKIEDTASIEVALHAA